LFRSNFENLLLQIKDISEPLVTMKSGVLDLHDLSFGELKLLGIHYRTSRYQSVPRSIEESLQADLVALPEGLLESFEVPEWDESKLGQPDPIRGEEVLAKLLKLRVIKAGLWVEQAFPRLRGSVEGTRIFLERLQTGDYVKQPSAINSDPTLDTISDQRRQSLISELLIALEESSAFYNQLQRTQELMDQLRLMSTIANELKLQSDPQQTRLDTAMSQFRTQADGVLKFLGDSRVRGEAQRESRDALVGYQIQLAKQFEKRNRVCQERRFRDPGELQLFAGDGPFEVAGSRFTTMSLCQNRRMFAVRLPGDFSQFMTTYVGPARSCPAATASQCQALADCQWTQGTCVQSPRPWSRVFKGSRPIILAPLSVFEDVKQISKTRR
jgi:hypothetical protein